MKDKLSLNEDEQEKSVVTRRNAAKTVLASAGVVAWHKPLLQAVVSPAHAMTSEIIPEPEPMVDMIVTTEAASSVEFEISSPFLLD